MVLLCRPIHFPSVIQHTSLYLLSGFQFNQRLLDPVPRIPRQPLHQPPPLDPFDAVRGIRVFFQITEDFLTDLCNNGVIRVFQFGISAVGFVLFDIEQAVCQLGKPLQDAEKCTREGFDRVDEDPEVTGCRRQVLRKTGKFGRGGFDPRMWDLTRFVTEGARPKGAIRNWTPDQVRGDVFGAAESTPRFLFRDWVFEMVLRVRVFERRMAPGRAS